MKITTDWHIHTKCSCDSACMEFETLVLNAKELGITDFGVSDHYHTILQEPDIAASRKEFDSTLERHPELRGHFHFGIETTLVSAWEADKIRRGEYTEPPIYGFRQGGPKNAPVIFDMDEEFLTKYGVEYFIAGMHWPMYCDTDVVNEKLVSIVSVIRIRVSSYTAKHRPLPERLQMLQEKER